MTRRTYSNGSNGQSHMKAMNIHFAARIMTSIA
jgi:hypothetical protein